MMATELATPKNSYQEAFRTFQGSLQDTSADWLGRVRENAMARFEELGFPSVKDEEWKYTNTAPIARIDFKPQIATETESASADAKKLASLSVIEAKDSELVFV